LLWSYRVKGRGKLGEVGNLLVWAT
jgi:hypothetical protein